MGSSLAEWLTDWLVCWLVGGWSNIYSKAGFRELNEFLWLKTWLNGRIAGGWSGCTLFNSCDAIWSSLLRPSFDHSTSPLMERVFCSFLLFCVFVLTVVVCDGQQRGPYKDKHTFFFACVHSLRSMQVKRRFFSLVSFTMLGSSECVLSVPAAPG